MLKNVKTSDLLKIIFSFIDEKQKLDLIKYNKTLQNYININLYNYKLFSGKFIEYGLNGKGKEYDYNGHLLYEGVFLNGKKNGYGKEYPTFTGIGGSELIFEGEFLNGLRNGKGKENDYNDHLLFEGEFLKGKRNWYGKEYLNGELIFEGEYLNGERKNLE